MGSAYYALVLGSKPILNLLSHFVISPAFNNTRQSLGYSPSKKLYLQNLNLIFPVVLRVFDAECHDQISVKVELVMCGLVFIKFDKIEKPPPRKRKG